MLPAVVFGLAVGWSSPEKPRERRAEPVVVVNGKANPKSTPNGSDQRWASGEVTVVIDASVDALGPGAREAVENSFGTWLASGAKLPNLRFETGTNLPAKIGQDEKSSVVFAPITIPGHKHDLAVTIGYADSETGRLLEADVIVNSDKPFALLDPSAAGDDDESSDSCDYDLQNVVTHEVGHFFGLDEDYDDTDATMFYRTARCELKKRDLEAPDSSEMSVLYEKPMSSLPESGASGCSITGKRNSSFSIFWLFGVALALFAARSGQEVRRG